MTKKVEAIIESEIFFIVIELDNKFHMQVDALASFE